MKRRHRKKPAVPPAIEQQGHQPIDRARVGRVQGKVLGRVGGARPPQRADRCPRRAAGGRSENELGSAALFKLGRRQAPHNPVKAADTLRAAVRMRRQDKAAGGEAAHDAVE